MKMAIDKGEWQNGVLVTQSLIINHSGSTNHKFSPAHNRIVIDKNLTDDLPNATRPENSPSNLCWGNLQNENYLN